MELSHKCDENHTTTQRRDRTQALIQAIHNAPSLEKLVFANEAVVKIEDIESLHAAATRLKHLELISIYLCSDGNEADNQAHYHPVQNLCLSRLKMLEQHC